MSDTNSIKVNVDTEQNASPAYFLSLAIRNFRCFGPEQTLDLSDEHNKPSQWTVILGENGVGKTTLLQCIAALQPYKLVTPDFAYFPCMLAKDYNDLFHDWIYGEANEVKPFEVQSLIALGANLDNRDESKRFATIHVTGGVGVATFGSESVVVDGLICYGYGANRRMGSTSLSEVSSYDTSDSLFSDQVGLLNPEEWLLQADYAASRTEGLLQKRAQRRRDRIITILKRLLPGVENIRFTQTDVNSMTPLVQVKTPYGWVPIHGLSLGYRTLLTWMVDLASRLFDRYPESQDPLAEPAVVLIDEIDLHLHPSWQRTLMQDLSAIFRNTQFIVTAHSPLVVQAATDANIVLLRREGDHVVIDNDVETIKNWRVDQVLTSDLFGLESARPPQVDELLKQRNEILAKGELTATDQEKLAQLEREIGPLPTGETPEDMDAMDIIRRAANLLKDQTPSKQEPSTKG